jgi:phosphoribosylamine---glycine ligase
VDVLILGGGAREHALAWKIRQSPLCDRLWCAPGNAGIAEVADCLPLGAEDLDGITTWAAAERPDLVVVGPEAPLAAGVADRLRGEGLCVFGPSAAAAQIEGSKAYARQLMARLGVPQPAYARFDDPEAAVAYLDRLDGDGVRQAVVKADGLAAGKGAIVCDTLAEARRAVHRVMVEGAFGAAGRTLVIEERLEGEEASLLVLTDGTRVVPCLPAQDYKRAGDGDQGPNTGGMGCYAPAPLITPELYDEALRTIIAPVLAGLREEGRTFQGCLYCGVMKTAAGLKVIEFNCRFGDPETEAQLPLLESDLLELLLGAAAGDLAGAQARWRPGGAVGVVLASGGYPGAYRTGCPITGLDEAAHMEGVAVFHAGTRRAEGQVVTAGGRVLCVTGVGGDFRQARDRAYAAVNRLRFEGAFCRSDIAAKIT